jgi:hypothetical protein
VAGTFLVMVEVEKTKNKKTLNLERCDRHRFSRTPETASLIL